LVGSVGRPHLLRAQSDAGLSFEVGRQGLAEPGGLAVGVAVETTHGVGDRRGSIGDQRFRRRERVLVDVQAHRNVELRGPVRLDATQLLADRQLAHASLPWPGVNRAATAAPWAGRSSASASAWTCGATSRNAGSSYSTTCTPRRNDWTDSPEVCRALPPVGSTWLEPAA